MTKSSPLVRVLVIEDNPDDSELLLRQLKKAEMASQVKFISDGQETVTLLTEKEEELGKSVMVIFLDLKLPGLSGLEVLRRLRDLPQVAKIPVIVMTSSNDPLDVEACRQLGVVNYVEKPVTFASFSKAMADVFHLPKTGSREKVPYRTEH